MNVQTFKWLMIIIATGLIYSCTRVCDCSELTNDNGIMKDKRKLPYTGECYVKIDGITKHFFYKDGKLHGISYMFGKSGKKVAELRFYNGIREGRQLIFTETGDTLIEEHFKQGMKDGLQKEWYENRHLKSLSSYKTINLMDYNLAFTKAAKKRAKVF